MEPRRVETMQSDPLSSETESGADMAPEVSSDPQAKKRVEIGLSPRRPTARAVVQRPPRTGLARWQQWVVVGLVVALMAVTGLLVAAKITGASTAWPQVRLQLASWLLGKPLPGLPAFALPSADYDLRIEDPFDQKTGLLACNQQAGQWTTDIVPERGIYRFQLWPGRLAWSTLAVTDLPTYRLDASFTIVDVMPEGYTGFLARYQDPQNFYLFVVDGAARYQVLLWQAGVLTTVQPWTPSPVINSAGYENVLALVEDGQSLHFFANNQLLFAVDAPLLPPGATGLVGGAGERTMAEITVDWLRLYERRP
jgi:hypothetical protein